MKRIDFLSNSPRTFIFEKNANKTSIGGFLTIIYLVILVILAFAYIYNYEVNMKYVISYGFYQTEKTEDEKSKLRDDPSYNPTLTFEFDVEDMLGNSLSDNYVLLDFTSGNLIKRNEPIEFNVSNLYIIVLYNCSDMSCPIQPEDVFAYQGYYMRITVKRSYFKFDLQDKEEPVKKTKYVWSYYVFNPDIPQTLTFFWQVAKVIEEKGMLDNFFGTEKISFGGNFDKTEFSTIKTPVIDSKYYSIFNFTGIYKPLFVLNSENSFREYVEYRRKRISEFDILANICSLSLTIYNGFKFAFAFFYSQNFDNYKIIDKILTSKGRNENKFQKMKDIKSDNSPLLLNDNNISQENEKDNEEIYKAMESNERNTYTLPKFHFYSFIFNIFSCVCSKKNKTQKCISTCNEITQKYNSIEQIIYNQFMIENLLKDYKWNNPELKSINNIDLIDKLNLIITDEN